MTEPDTYALAAWRMLEHAWRSAGSLAPLAAGFRPEGFDHAPVLTIADTGRLDRLEQAQAARLEGEIRLSLPLEILDVWVDVDDLAEALIEAIARSAAG